MGMSVADLPLVLFHFGWYQAPRLPSDNQSVVTIFLVLLYVSGYLGVTPTGCWVRSVPRG